MSIWGPLLLLCLITVVVSITVFGIGRMVERWRDRRDGT